MTQSMSALISEVNYPVNVDLHDHLAVDGIGKRVRELRLSLGLTQTQLAKRAGVTQGTISNLERADSTYVLGPTLAGLSEALNTNVEFLTSGQGAPGPAVHAERSEAELLQVFRNLSDADRDALLRVARSMNKSSQS